MPSGSIPHGQQRPQDGKRHTRIPETGYQHASDDVDHMSDEELDWQMYRTLADIMFLTHRYMRQFDEKGRRTGGIPRSRESQVIVMHLVGWAHMASTPEEADELHRRMQEAGF